MTSRALRVGVVIGGTLVEEKVLDGSAPITFGQSLRCTLSVPVEGVPREHVLWALDQGRFVMRVTAAMDGRLAQGEHLGTLDEARRAVAPADGVWALPVARGARGKLVIGDATLLFQEIAKPAPAPRAQLPAAIRGTFADRIDRRLAAIIGGSLAVHVAIAAFAWNNDAGSPLLLEPPQFTEFSPATIDVMLPPDPVKPAPVATQPGAATPVAPPRAVTPIGRPPAHVIAPVARVPEAARTEDAQRLASILASEETAQRGVGGMGSHRPGSGLAQELEDIRTGHHPVTIGDDGHGTRTQHFGVDERPHDLPLGNPDGVHEQTKAEDHAPHGRIPLGGVKTDDKTTLTAQVVLDKINALYLAGLERCYRRELTLDAQLSGKVAISFTVGENGKATDPDAQGANAQLDHCISSQMGGWRFPIPHDAKGEPTEATFHISLALQSS
jgi:hypothetical protein